uniref:Nuclear factor, erythroid derived 2, like 3 n=1 Tax=Nannospalax galili TaxID=1026970 RepID=A0A8C6RWF0_NANGA
MKLFKPWWTARGGLLHLTLLLSLAGLRVDLDLYLLPPPASLFRDELLARGAYALSPFAPSRGSRELDPAAPLEGQLLREVRSLGVPFIPRTRVDAWLVHSVATGDADGAHGLLGAAASSAVGEGGSQVAAGGDGDPRAARDSPLAGAEEKGAAEPTTQVRDAGGRASQENEILREKTEAVNPSSKQEEKEEGVSAHKQSRQQSGDNENKMADAPGWEAEILESRNESHLNWADTSFSLEDFFQLLSSQPEHSLEGISLEGIPPFSGCINEEVNSSAHYSTNFSHAVSHDVNLHEAMLCPNTFGRDPVARTSYTQEPPLQLYSHTNLEQALPAINLTGFLTPVINQMRNQTNQDLMSDLDTNIFDEINPMSLAIGGFSSLEVFQPFEEPDSELLLNSSHDSNSITKSNSHSINYRDLQPFSFHDLEGAVGGCYTEPHKLCHMDLGCQHVFHNHTYHLQTCAPEPTTESLTWPGKSQKTNREINPDRDLSRDEQRAKALHIPFSVDEIVRMPVDNFNSMLSRYYLTDLQISLIRDIRRRGKNKVAAQNCRKRKLDLILNLEDDIRNLQAKKEALNRERGQCNKAIDIMKQKLHHLYYDVFSKLRDDQGRPVNPNQYALQCSHDGTVLIVPKDLVTSGHRKEAQKGKRKGERKN